MKHRESSIELLRILAGISVIILHFNYMPTGGGAIIATSGNIKNVFEWFEAICICAVNVYILISGYFNINSKSINVSRLLKILIQTIVYSFMCEVFYAICSSNFDYKRIIRAFIPSNYYVILYITLMMIAPYINVIINNLSKNGVKKLIVIAFSIFSIYPTVVEVFEEIINRQIIGLSSISMTGSGAGYTIVNFILMYIMGASIRKLNVENINRDHLIFILCIGWIVIFLWGKIFVNTAYMYCNPIVILESVCVFCFFLKLKVNSTLINIIAPASFSCYLIHEKFLLAIFKLDLIKDNVGIIYLMVISVIIIYILSFLIMKVWNAISWPFYKKTVNLLSNIKIIE